MVWGGVCSSRKVHEKLMFIGEVGILLLDLRDVEQGHPTVL